jgi:hypothetical protein
MRSHCQLHIHSCSFLICVSALSNVPFDPPLPQVAHTLPCCALRERACLKVAVCGCCFQYPFRALSVPLYPEKPCCVTGVVVVPVLWEGPWQCRSQEHVLVISQTSAFRSCGTGSPFAHNHTCRRSISDIKRQCPLSLLPSSAAGVLYLTAFLSAIRACAEQQLLKSAS